MRQLEPANYATSIIITAIEDEEGVMTAYFSGCEGRGDRAESGALDSTIKQQRYIPSEHVLVTSIDLRYKPTMPY